jgi:hypothetical protein
MNDKNLCKGCRNDYYNQTKDGGCWLLQNAKQVQRTRVGYSQNPPYTWDPKTVYDCYETAGYAWIKENDIRIVK